MRRFVTATALLAVFGRRTPRPWRACTGTVPTSDGEPMEMHGRFTDVKAERDGQWVYIMDHASVPLPPPPDGMN